MFENVLDGLSESFSVNAVRKAICVNGLSKTYDELYKSATRVAHEIGKLGVDSGGAYVGVFCYRSFAAYESILGVLFAGKAYMPLNKNFPIDRLKSMIVRSNTRIIIVDDICIDLFSQFCSDLNPLSVFLIGNSSKIEDFMLSNIKHKIVHIGNSIYDDIKQYPVPNVSTDMPAYLLFTSGSTGEPKGVSVSHGNLSAYLKFVLSRYDIGHEDRISQMFDLTFDLSVHDIFTTFLSGACLYVVPENNLFAPTKFIKENNITVWFSVPSVIRFMSKLKMLKRDSLSSIRLSLFCGEALSYESVVEWMQATNNSVVENLYGPTEATIAIMFYNCNNINKEKCINGIVPIGYSFEDGCAEVLIDNMQIAGANQIGELCLCGRQITNGYLNDSIKTSEKYININGVVWYRTGDLVRKDSDGCFHFIGRLDEQIKIKGYRVELQEIENIIRDFLCIDSVVCLPIAFDNGHADALCVVIEGQEDNNLRKSVLDECRNRLPVYMVPQRIEFISEMPLNSNGKIDKKVLRGLYG